MSANIDRKLLATLARFIREEQPFTLAELCRQAEVDEKVIHLRFYAGIKAEAERVMTIIKTLHESRRTIERADAVLKEMNWQRSKAVVDRASSQRELDKCLDKLPALKKSIVA